MFGLLGVVWKFNVRFLNPSSGGSIVLWVRSTTTLEFLIMPGLTYEIYLGASQENWARNDNDILFARYFKGATSRKSQPGPKCWKRPHVINSFFIF